MFNSVFVWLNLSCNSVARSCYLSEPKNKIDSQEFSNESLSIVGNARIDGSCGQKCTLTSSMGSSIKPR